MKIPGKTGEFLVQSGVQNAKDGFSDILLILDPGSQVIKGLFLLRVEEILTISEPVGWKRPEPGFWLLTQPCLQGPWFAQTS